MSRRRGIAVVELDLGDVMDNVGVDKGSASVGGGGSTGVAGAKARASAVDAAPASKRKVIVVANRTGGQGKTLIAQLLSTRLDASTTLFMSADAGVGGGEASKLAKVLKTVNKTVVDRGIGYDAASARVALRNDTAFWDAFGHQVIAKKGPPVFLMDLGANVVDGLLEWGAEVGGADVMGDAAEFVFIIPIVSSDQARADATTVATKLAGGTCFPMAKLVFVFNESQGTFAPNAAKEFTDSFLAGLEKSGGRPRFDVTSDVLRCCDSPAVMKGCDEGVVAFAAIDAMSVSEARSSLGLDPFQAPRGLAKFKAWLNESSERAQSWHQPRSGVDLNKDGRAPGNIDDAVV